jgi:precorrin-3B synthase
VSPTSPIPIPGRAISRPAADRCPGVLRLAAAADGHLARIRLPGGLVTADWLRELARLAGELGDGRVELTSRGNLQLRGLAADAAGPLTDALARAGLLPSLSHDRVRNVLASPLAGLDGSPDLTGVVRTLDAAVCARPRLAELSGRFLFAVDDGRGDVAGLGADVVATLRPDGAEVNGLSVRGADVTGGGPEGPAADGADAGCVPDGLRDAIVAAMLACAEAFLDMNRDGAAWRVADLPGGAERVRAVVAARLGLATAEREPGAVAQVRPVGLVQRGEEAAGGESAPAVPDKSGRAAVLLASLGRLTSAQLTWIADLVADRPARITPWRSVVLPGLADAAGVLRAAGALGFGVDDTSPWLRVTACAGRPGCASALADVQADAAAFAARWRGRLVHVSGCARHCGRPAATEIDVTATSEGYDIAGV